MFCWTHGPSIWPRLWHLKFARTQLPCADWSAGSPSGQGEVEAVPRSPVDVMAVLHRPSLLVIGRTLHDQQRRPLALAQRAGLGRGRGPRPDGLLGDPHGDAVRPE